MCKYSRDCCLMVDQHFDILQVGSDYGRQLDLKNFVFTDQYQKIRTHILLVQEKV